MIEAKYTLVTLTRSIVQINLEARFDLISKVQLKMIEL